MKNKQFCLLGAFVTGVVLFAVASCEKMNLGDRSGSSDDEKDANVLVCVRSFEQTPFEAGTRAKKVSDVCTRLNFAVFDSGGERVQQKDQKVSDEDFGRAYFNLPVGNYRLVVLAHSSNGNPTLSNAQKIGFTNAKGYTDTFFNSQELNVGEDTISLNLNLKRIVAMVRFIPDDEPPARTDSIRFYYVGGSGSLDATADGWGVVKSKQTHWFKKETGTKKYEIYTIPRQDSQYLEVTAGAYQGADLLSSCVIDSIPIKRNCITTCRGKLFDGKVTKASFTITVDDQWESDTTIYLGN